VRVRRDDDPLPEPWAGESSNVAPTIPASTVAWGLSIALGLLIAAGIIVAISLVDMRM
jgi:hypothetical protein